MNEEILKLQAEEVRKEWNEWLEDDQMLPPPSMLDAMGTLIDSIIGPEDS